MNKNNNYDMAEKKNTLEEKHEQDRVRFLLKKRLRFLLTSGIVLILISAVVFFWLYRPLTKFVYYECANLGQNWILIDRTHVKVIYYVDGKEYEKILLIDEDDYSTKMIIYYNAEDPNDVMKAEDRTTALLISLFGTGFGTFFIILGIRNYKKRIAY